MLRTRDHRARSIRTRKLSRDIHQAKSPTAFARRMRQRYWMGLAPWVPCLILFMLGTQWLGGVMLTAQDSVMPWVALLGSVGLARLVVLGFWLVTIGVSLLIPVMVVVIVGTRVVLPRYRDWIAACGRCPGCGYEIMNLPQEPDGCTVCPECGSAWWCHEKGPEPA